MWVLFGLAIVLALLLTRNEAAVADVVAADDWEDDEDEDDDVDDEDEAEDGDDVEPSDLTIVLGTSHLS